MKTLALTALCLFSTSAFAFKDGTYQCKNAVDTTNSYRFETTTVGNASLPYVEATLHYRKDSEDKNSPLMDTTVKGFATLSTTGDVELLSLNYLHFEFVNGVLSHCIQ